MTSKSNAEQHQGEAQHGLSDVPAIKREERKIGTHPTDSDSNNFKKTANWEKRHFAINAIIAVVGGLALIIYWCQLREMRKSTDAATRAAKAAEDSITFARNSAHLDQRAWVAPIDVTGKPEEGKPYKVAVTFKNTGRTFAKNSPMRSSAGERYPAI